MKRKDVHIIAGIIAAIVIVAALTVVSAAITRDAAAKRLKDAYSALGTNVEILSLKEESGVYRVVLRPVNATTVQEIYVTKDGQLLLRNVERLEDFTSRILREDNFSQCLAERRVVVFGASNDLNTLQQLQILGSFAGRVFFDCSSNLQTCVSLNVTSVPTTFYQNTLYPGVQPASFFTQLTGCSL